MTDASTVLNDLKNRIAFINEDLILISLMNNFEVLFQVSSLYCIYLIMVEAKGKQDYRILPIGHDHLSLRIEDSILINLK